MSAGGTAFFTPAQIAMLAAPHVSQAWFARLDLPAGEARLFTGVSVVAIDGEDWRGVSDPIGGRLVGLSGVEEPAFGQAAAVTITLTGADAAFLRSVHATRREIEGRRADLYWCAFDAESEKPITSLIPLFAAGRMSAPAIRWASAGRRTVTLTIENAWASQNFRAGRRWNPADQQKVYPGDLGLNFVGVEVSEVVK